MFLVKDVSKKYETTEYERSQIFTFIKMFKKKYRVMTFPVSYMSLNGTINAIL